MSTVIYEYETDKQKQGGVDRSLVRNCMMTLDPTALRLAVLYHLIFEQSENIETMRAVINDKIYPLLVPFALNHTKHPEFEIANYAQVNAVLNAIPMEIFKKGEEIGFDYFGGNQTHITAIICEIIGDYLLDFKVSDYKSGLDENGPSHSISFKARYTNGDHVGGYSFSGSDLIAHDSQTRHLKIPKNPTRLPVDYTYYAIRVCGHYYCRKFINYVIINQATEIAAILGGSPSEYYNDAWQMIAEKPSSDPLQQIMDAHTCSTVEAAKVFAIQLKHVKIAFDTPHLKTNGALLDTSFGD